MTGLATRRPTVYRPVRVPKPPSRDRDSESENDLNASSKKPWPGPWGRIGGLAGTTIILGTIVQLAAFGFLIFLWTGRGSDSSGDKASSLWRRIFREGDGTRVVTVCALIIRSIVGLQATVCTGLAAALVLEARNVVNVGNAASFSILRAVNGGPISFVTPLAQTPGKLFTSLPAALILVLWLVSMAISFSSTILLSDFHTMPLISSSSTSLVPVIEASSELVGPFGMPNLGPQPGIWQQIMQTFPTFGEATLEKPIVRDGLADTGIIKRSLIPLQPQSRKGLRSYQGASIVHTSRAGCVRPVLTGSITGIPPLTTISHPMEFATIAGNLTWKSQDGTFLDGLSCGPTGSDCPSHPFYCGMPWAYTGPQQPILPRQPTSLCIFRTFPYHFGSSEPNESASAFMLVLDTDVTLERWADIFMSLEHSKISSIPIPKQSSSQEWAVMDFGRGFTLNATVCVVNSTLSVENVSLSTTVDPLEPEIQYNTSTHTWETDAIVNMTGGVGNASYASRGILSLDTWTDIPATELDEMYRRSPNYNPDFLDSTDITKQFFEEIQKGVVTNDLVMGYSGLNFSVYVCGVCSTLGGSSVGPTKLSAEQAGGSTWQAHPYISLLLHAVENKTSSMAQALHATFFRLYQSQYSNAIAGLDMGSNSTMTWSSEASVPVASTGLIIVGVFVLVNLICVFAITGLFLWKTHWSMYGNVWHAVAQLVAGPEMLSILEVATAATDSEVNGKLKEEGIRDVKVGLWDQGDGRLAVSSGSDHSTDVTDV